ncbi:predicted protein [Chaetomium globosum CBS 148.51]|uniref:Hydrophobin n=1 Tax=Chaetomium globosum (strain ATCC 6205 / CBS 148.51 / DSM 1962 / NBRC 6347 / NRRL 1970) TaxID=306901 RepID=Q2HHZ5_CHAGB|nr:uncharacterized protein CHGG_00159 [Chaetomium globosum CBS 148.51]EAQ91924.1 predicted protein [Chaetomium globosum CBS 148.51]
MKPYFTALLALPAALAVPVAKPRHAIATTATAISPKHRACTLVRLSSPANGPRMETVFTDAYCAQATGGNLSKAVCKSITICKDPLIPETEIGTFYVLC